MSLYYENCNNKFGSSLIKLLKMNSMFRGSLSSLAGKVSIELDAIHQVLVQSSRFKLLLKSLNSKNHEQWWVFGENFTTWWKSPKT